MKIDMHVHTKYGDDCLLEPTEMIRRAKEIGLDAVCVTEHHSYSASEPVCKIAELEDFLVLRGAEYHSSDGHLLLYGVRDDRFNWGKYMPIQEVIDYVNSIGGLVVAAHPYQKAYTKFMCDKIYRLRGIAAVETMNGRIPAEQNKAAEQAAKILGLSEIGGSDAHSAREIGRAYTVFEDGIKSIDDLLVILRRGKYRPELFTGNLR
jgi:predicted metal-dependent phosphoesterase TrpH